MSFGPPRDGRATFQRLDTQPALGRACLTSTRLACVRSRRTSGRTGRRRLTTCTTGSATAWARAASGSSPGSRASATAWRPSTSTASPPTSCARTSTNWPRRLATTAMRLLPGYDQWVLGPGTADAHVVPPARRTLVSRRGKSRHRRWTSCPGRGRLPTTRSSLPGSPKRRRPRATRSRKRSCDSPRSSATSLRPLDPLEEVAGLAVEHAAHGFEGAEAHGLGSPVLQHGDVGRGEPDRSANSPTLILRLATRRRYGPRSASDHRFHVGPQRGGLRSSARITTISSPHGDAPATDATSGHPCGVIPPPGRRRMLRA